MNINLIVFLGICLTIGSTSGQLCSDNDLNFRIACHMDLKSGLNTHLAKFYTTKIYAVQNNNPFNDKPEGHAKLCKWFIDHPRNNAAMRCPDIEMNWRVACHMDRDQPLLNTNLVKSLAIKIFGTPTPFNGKPHEPYVEKICHYLKEIPVGTGISG